VHARVDFVLCFPGCCESTAEGLQDQRDQIRANEDDRVSPGCEEREWSSVGFYDAAEGEVDWGGDQCWGDGEADELDDEVSASTC
jgi:hypothetical protein